MRSLKGQDDVIGAREGFDDREGTFMRVMVLGGDGYLGWPTALHLSARGHEVAIVDNLVRRDYDVELGTGSLVPVSDLESRVARWSEVSGRAIDVVVGDLTNFEVVEGTLRSLRPEAIVHFGEQRSAPYSMIDRKHAVYTQVQQRGRQPQPAVRDRASSTRRSTS